MSGNQRTGILLGILCSAVGAALSSLGYAATGPFHPLNWVSAAIAVLTAISYSIARHLAVRRKWGFFLLATSTYLWPVLALAVLYLTSLKDPEALMWLPVVAIFFFIYWIPVAIGVTVGALLTKAYTNSERREPDAPSAPP